MKEKKITVKKPQKKASKQNEVFLPLDVYKSLIKDVEKYEEIKKEKGIDWIDVQVNVPEKKKN